MESQAGLSWEIELAQRSHSLWFSMILYDSVPFDCLWSCETSQPGIWQDAVWIEILSDGLFLALPLQSLCTLPAAQSLFSSRAWWCSPTQRPANQPVGPPEAGWWGTPAPFTFPPTLHIVAGVMLCTVHFFLSSWLLWEEVLLTLFYRWKNWGSLKLSNWLEVTQPARGRKKDSHPAKAAWLESVPPVPSLKYFLKTEERDPAILTGPSLLSCKRCPLWMPRYSPWACHGLGHSLEGQFQPNSCLIFTSREWTCSSAYATHSHSGGSDTSILNHPFFLNLKPNSS